MQFRVARVWKLIKVSACSLRRQTRFQQLIWSRAGVGLMCCGCGLESGRSTQKEPTWEPSQFQQIPIRWQQERTISMTIRANQGSLSGWKHVFDIRISKGISYHHDGEDVSAMTSCMISPSIIKPNIPSVDKQIIKHASKSHLGPEVLRQADGARYPAKDTQTDPGSACERLPFDSEFQVDIKWKHIMEFRKGFWRRFLWTLPGLSAE